MDRPRSRPHTRHTPPLPEGRALQRTRAVPMLEPLRRWMGRSDPGPFDGPTAQEVSVVVGGLLFAPLLLPLLWLALPFTSAFSGMHWAKRVFNFLTAPITLPIAYLMVLYEVHAAIWQRVQARRQALRQAEKAVQELLDEAFEELPL
ncbi:MAG: hypothetical protein ACK46G_12790 [Flavobacteriales bacterium]